MCRILQRPLPENDLPRGIAAAVIATHNMELAKRMDRILRLEHGHIVEG